MLVVVLPSPVTLNVFEAEPFCIFKTISVSAPLPLLNVNPSCVESVTISAVADELSYACCSVVVDKPPLLPVDSPNLETQLNIACDVLDKLLAFLLTDIIPIKIPLSLLLTYSINDSVW